MNMLGGLVQQVEGGQPAPEHAENNFEQIASMLPQGALASGLAEAFKSSETPAFGALTSQLFGNSNSDQKAGMLNTLLSAAGPALMSGGASGLLSQIAGGGQRPITPEEAEQVSPDVVHQLAAHAEKHDPSIVDTVTGFYSEHPTLVKTLGGAVLAITLAKLANRQ
jgi:hypothetical protein